MKTEEKPSKQEIASEQLHLFQEVMFVLNKQENDLSENFDLSRNMACSEFSRDFLGRLTPTKIIPEKTELLQKNFETLRSEISRKRYYAIVAFWKQRTAIGVPLSERQKDCFDYWEKQLGLLSGKHKNKKTSLKQHI